MVPCFDIVAYDGIWQLVATFGSMWLHMHLNGFISFKCSNMVSFSFLQLHIVDQRCMWSNTVSNGSIWLHAIYVICLFIVVVCGLIYSQICFHLYGFIWSLRLYIVLFHIVEYCCQQSLQEVCPNICVLLMWIHMIASRQYNAILILVWQGIILNFNDNLFHM